MDSVKVSLDRFPEEILQVILSHLSARDLCRMALCSRSWREVANRNGVWRALCRWEGWERYGTVADLCTEPPFARQVKGFNESVSFSSDCLVTGSDSQGVMTSTCKWKEVYMKARHLEANWRENRYHLVEFEYGAPGCVGYFRNSPQITQAAAKGITKKFPEIIINMAGEGDLLAFGILNHSLQIWDMSCGECRHSINVGVSSNADVLEIKNGILVVGCADGQVRTYSVQTGEKLREMSGHKLPVSRLFFDGDTIVSVAQPPRHDEDISDISDEEDEESEDEDSDNEDLPDHSIIWVRSAAGGTDAYCYKLTRGTEQTRLLHFDYDDKTVAGAFKDQTICVWNATDGSLKHTIGSGLKQLISCHLGEGLIIGTNNNKAPLMKMWDLQSGNLISKSNVRDAKLFKDNTFQVNKFAAYYFNGDVLIIRSAWGVLASVGLDGKYLSDTKSPDHKTLLKLVVVRLRGNRVIAADYCNGKMYLWRISRDGTLTLVKELRPTLNDEIDSKEFSLAWMNDTKMAFVHYFEESEELEDQVQVPKIVVHHYW